MKGVEHKISCSLLKSTTSNKHNNLIGDTVCMKTITVECKWWIHHVDKYRSLVCWKHLRERYIHAVSTVAHSLTSVTSSSSATTTESIQVAHNGRCACSVKQVTQKEPEHNLGLTPQQQSEEQDHRVSLRNGE